MCNDKSKKCNKGTCALWVSIAALLLCLIVFGLWIFEAIPHSVVTPDSFIGTCVSVLSIIVTIAIGWQIFNVVEVKNTMKELKERLEEVEKLRVEIKRIKDKSEDTKHTTFHLHEITLAMYADKEGLYDLACIHCLSALAECMQMNNPINAKFIIDRFGGCLSSLKGNVRVKPSVNEEILEMDDIIRKSKDFNWIVSDYEELYTNFKQRLTIEE